MNRPAMTPTLGEFVDEFCKATAGQSPENVARSAYALRLEACAAVRDEAARLVERHFAGLNLDVGVDLLVRAIHAIELANY